MYNTANGLSGNFTENVVEDENGFIWVLNENVIHRFNGNHFQAFSPPDSDLLAEDRNLNNLRIYEDSLLFVTTRERFLLMNTRNGEWTSLARDQTDRAIAFVISQPHKDTNRFLLGFINQERTQVSFKEFSGRSLSESQYPDIPYRKFTHIIRDEEGRLFQAFENKIVAWAKDGRELGVQQELVNCPDCEIVSLAANGQGELIYLVYYPDGSEAFLIQEIQEKSKAKEHPASRFIAHEDHAYSNFFLLESGDVIFNGGNHQLGIYHTASDAFSDYQLVLKEQIPQARSVLSSFIDRTGTIWISIRLGLVKMTLPETTFSQYFAQPTDVCEGYCSFRGMEEGPSGIIYASYYGGIAEINGQLTNNQISIDTDCRIPSNLLGTEEGIWLPSGQLWQEGSLSPKPVLGSLDGCEDETFFAQSTDGQSWWLTKNDLFRLVKENEVLSWELEFRLPIQESYKTNAIHCGVNSNKLWIGHNGQLLRYDPSTNEMVWFDPADSGIKASRILAIEENEESDLWLGTDVGLLFFDARKNSFQQYTTQNGLPHDFVCGLLSQGDSCLWLSTSEGLSRFHITSKEFINFFAEDGLSHNEFNRKSYFKAKDGRMYFGGLRGINAFYPDELMRDYRQANSAAKVALSSLEYIDRREDTILKNHLLSNSPEIELRHWQGSFTFEYLLTDYRNPDQVYYSYRMFGYEDQWSPPSPYNFTRFSSLPIGQYDFQVKARDSQGNWHPNELRVGVRVLAPWWKTGWAYLSYLLFILATTWLIYRELKRRWQLRNAFELEQAEANRLKELDSFKSRLYTNLTHEFRTPLTVILGMVDQLEVQPDKYLEDSTRLIKSNGQSLLRLINQLLDLSKLESNSFQPQLIQDDVVGYLRYITESFQTFANSNNLALQYKTTLETLAMDYDPEQLKQVLTNLISNAVKFTPSGGKVLINVAEQDGSLLVRVTDTGIGIAAEDLPHVFDRFYQVDGSLTRQGEGTGIGLAHSLELIKLMKGEIEVNSRLGQGTVFSLRLPIQHTAPLADQRNVPSVLDDWKLTTAIPVESVINTGETGPQLLIIEDNADVVTYLQSCLQDFYTIDVAYNGRIGIEKALEKVPDLIISDVMMPEKDGYEVCDTLKNDQRSSHIPIILLTAKADVASKMAGLRRGADVYLSKPFNKEELLVRLSALHERQERMAAFFSGTTSSDKLVASAELVEAIEIEDVFIQHVRELVAAHYQDEDFGLPQLCQKVRMSRSQLFRKMKALIGVAPAAFIRDFRLDQARQLLTKSNLNVSEVAYEVGFKDLSHFSKIYRETYGHVPRETSK